jgi:hypothetical protein
LIRKAPGKVRDLDELYSPAPYTGKSWAALPSETHVASAPYVPSSGPKFDGDAGKKKKTILSLVQAARKSRTRNVLEEKSTLKSCFINLFSQN